MTKEKKAIQELVEIIGEDKLAAPSKFGLYFFIGFIILVVGTALFAMIS